MNSIRNPGQVSINRGAEDPAAESLPYPTNRVVGLVTSEEAAWRVIDHLKTDGIEEEMIELFFGEAGAACLQSYHDRSGLVGHLVQIAENLGSEQDQSKEYEDALASGQVLIAVRAPADGATDGIQGALATEAATSVRYYGRLNIHDLA